jgi:gluconokinase
MPNAVLAIDVGTSSVRTALFDTKGRRLRGSQAQRTYPLLTNAQGRAELNPGKLLLATRACLDETHAWLAGAHPRYVVSAGAMSCFWHSSLGVNAAGKAVTPIITWADTRAAGQAANLRQEVDEAAYHARSGCMLHSSFWLARLRWLRLHDAHTFAQVALWLSPGEWLTWRMFGLRGCAHGMATGTGLYDPAACDWSDDLLTLAGIDRTCVQPIDEIAHCALLAKQKRWPLFTGALWAGVVGDGAAGNLGSGTGDGVSVALNYGTSAALRRVRIGTPRNTPLGLFAYRVDSQRYVVGGATSNAGSLRHWSDTHLRLPKTGLALDRWVLRQTPGAHGLTVLPFFSGERAPYWRDDLDGQIDGLRTSTTALDIAAALTEATFHRLAIIADAMPGSRRTNVIVSGGISRSRPAMQMAADVTGLSLRASAEPEASLRGAAVLALEQLGTAPPPPGLGPLVKPNATRTKQFRSLRHKHREMESRREARKS